MNVQGSFQAGRGADGLGAVRTVYNTSRFGPGVKTSTRPPHLTGKPTPPWATTVGVTPIKSVPVTYTPPRRRPRRGAKIRMRKQFMNWLKNWAPRVYADAKKHADILQAREGTLNGLGGWFDGFMDKVGDLGGKYLQFRTQKDILNAQMDRMRQGLPPLQTSEYAPTIAIKPDAGTTREITGAIGAGFGKMLPWIALGGGALLLLTMRRKRR